MAKQKNKAFTIVELIVAVALLVMLVGLSSVVFSTTVKAHRKAVATIEITRKLNALTTQLDADFRGLRKDGEIFLVWVAQPAIDEAGVEIVPLEYQKFDRIVFFADGDFQSMRQHDYGSDTNGDGDLDVVDGSKTIVGNLARISYMLARETNTTPAARITDWKSRILARTQHIVTADAALPVFPNLDLSDLPSTPWDPAVFDDDNFFSYEHQTMSMEDWTYMSTFYYTDPTLSAPEWLIKDDILKILTDIAVDSPDYPSDGSNTGPPVELSNPNTYHNLFCEGIRDFGIQIWLDDEQRWYPEIDPNRDGDYTDTDYPKSGNIIHPTDVDGILYTGNEGEFFGTFGHALKFTFTLMDSNGLFPDGKTFTHIVYLDN